MASTRCGAAAWGIGFNRRPSVVVFPAVGILLASQAWAQTGEMGSNISGRSIGSSASSAEATSVAEVSDPTGAPKRNWIVTPRLTLQETLTDNVSPGTKLEASDRITELAPGIRIVGQSARAKLNLDYSVKQLNYGRNTRGDQTQQELNGIANLEMIDKLLYLDLSGIINQQAISAFGVQSPEYAINDNLTETSTFRISPYFKGRLGGVANYEGRYSRTRAHSKSSSVADKDIGDWRGTLSGDFRATKFGWRLEAGRQNYDFEGGRGTESTNWRGMLGYQLTQELRFAASLGRESNDFVSADKQSWRIHGFGVDWQPGPRTQLSVFREKRFFGVGHSVTLSHRMRRSILKYSDSRDISALPTQFQGTALGSLYDLLFDQLADSIPDELMRSDYVAQLMAQNGLSPTAQVISSYLDSSVSARRQQELSFMLRGVRNTLTIAFLRSQDERLGLTDVSSLLSVSQRGISVGLSHQLSALTSLNIAGRHSHSSSMSSLGEWSTQKSLTAGVTTHLGAHTTAGLSARRTIFDNQATPYTENAVVGTLTLQF